MPQPHVDTSAPTAPPAASPEFASEPVRSEYEPLRRTIRLSADATTASADVAADIMQKAERAHRFATTLRVLADASTATGGHVIFSPDYHFFPVLLGGDSQPVPLYELVEVLDGLVDYAALKEEFPSLSYAQINGALLFLRKVAQFNVHGVDVDEMEAAEIADNPAFLEELRRAVADQEISRVLNYHE